MTDRARWKELFDAHWQFILRTMQRLGGPWVDAEEAAQEVLVLMWKKLDAFEGRSAVRTWLYGICLKVASDHRRKQRRRAALRALLGPFGSAPSPHARVEAKLALERVHALLDRLSAKRRDAFVLVEIESLSIEEAARVLEIPEATVRTRVFHARQDFLRMMEESEQ